MHGVGVLQRCRHQVLYLHHTAPHIYTTCSVVVYVVMVVQVLHVYCMQCRRYQSLESIHQYYAKVATTWYMLHPLDSEMYYQLQCWCSSSVVLHLHQQYKGNTCNTLCALQGEGEYYCMMYTSLCSGGVVGICSRCLHLVRSSPTMHPQYQHTSRRLHTAIRMYSVHVNAVYILPAVLVVLVLRTVGGEVVATLLTTSSHYQLDTRLLHVVQISQWK